MGKYLHMIPNLVVEILSSTTTKKDLEDKKALYECCRIDEGWIVDPPQRSVTMLALEARRSVVADSAQSIGHVPSEVLPRVSVDLKEIISPE